VVSVLGCYSYYSSMLLQRFKRQLEFNEKLIPDKLL